MYVHLFAVPEIFPGISELRKGGVFVVGLVEAGGGVFGGLFFVWFFFPSLLHFVLFSFKYQISPNLRRKAPDALLLLWVKKEQMTDWLSWMNVSIAFWLLATLLNVDHFGFVTFRLARNKFLLQLPHKMCLLL